MRVHKRRLIVVDGDAHLPVFRAALKGYYRQRCNTPKAATYAGAWADAAACHMGDLPSALDRAAAAE